MGGSFEYMKRRLRVGVSVYSKQSLFTLPVIHPSGASALVPFFLWRLGSSVGLDQNGRRRFFVATSVWQETWPFVLLAGYSFPESVEKGVSASP